MVVRCHPPLKSKALCNSKNLAKKTNSKERLYFIKAQIPESLLAEKKEISYNIQQVWRRNQNKNTEEKEKYKVKNGVLYVNEISLQKQVQPPKFAELFPDKAEQEKMVVFRSDTREGEHIYSHFCQGVRPGGGFKGIS